MQAHISISLQGVRGKEYKHLNNQGAISASIDYDGTTGRQIWVDAYQGSGDAYQGSGDTYQRREHSLINIYDYKGIPVFSGTFDQLTEQLKAGKEGKK